MGLILGGLSNPFRLQVISLALSTNCKSDLVSIKYFLKKLLNLEPKRKGGVWAQDPNCVN